MFKPINRCTSLAALLLSAAILLMALLVTACMSSTPTLLPPSTLIYTATLLPNATLNASVTTIAAGPTAAATTSAPTATPLATKVTPSAQHTATTTSTPAPPRLVILARNLNTPDDLVLAPDGSIIYSDIVTEAVERLGTDGKRTTVVSQLREPEGLAFLPDGSLIIVEQGNNRLLRFDFNSNQLSIFLQLENKTTHPGLDGIFFDAATQTLLVPDSPNGTLLRVSLEGKTRSVQTLARGLSRPTGAAVEADGSILVVDENAFALWRVPREGGIPQKIARLPEPDDVIVDANGDIYANTLIDDAIHLIDRRTGADQVLWRGFSNPQGIIFDSDGNLIVTDPGYHRIVKIVIHQ